MKYIKSFGMIFENLNLNLGEINDMGKYCAFEEQRDVYKYSIKIGDKNIIVYAYDKGTKLDYSVNDSYSINKNDKVF